MRRLLICMIAGVVLLVFLSGCAATTYAPGPPPPAKVEVKPHRPGPHAVWIAGHWQWTNHGYIWKPGHWEKKPKGQWVAGHWVKRPRGHVWVRGHWKR